MPSRASVVKDGKAVNVTEDHVDAGVPGCCREVYKPNESIESGGSESMTAPVPEVFSECFLGLTSSGKLVLHPFKEEQPGGSIATDP